jgi:hypothetical protein
VGMVGPRLREDGWWVEDRGDRHTTAIARLT